MSREVSSSVIPHAVNTQAIGATQQQTDNAFNDLKQSMHSAAVFSKCWLNNYIVGGWPASQKIKRIQLIEVFATDTAIRGIRIYYVLTDSKPVHILHGQAVGQLNRVPFDDGKYLKKCSCKIFTHMFPAWRQHDLCRHLWWTRYRQSHCKYWICTIWP